jgi:hypothetical protein
LRATGGGEEGGIKKKRKQVNQIGIFCDLTKTYGVINHETLLAELNSYGVRGIANLWFESYLAYRNQVVEINYNGNKNTNQGKYVSSLKEIKHGVLQDSNLRQVLLFLYISDLPIKEKKVILFANGRIVWDVDARRDSHVKL